MTEVLLSEAGVCGGGNLSGGGQKQQGPALHLAAFERGFRLGFKTEFLTKIVATSLLSISRVGRKGEREWPQR